MSHILTSTLTTILVVSLQGQMSGFIEADDELIVNKQQKKHSNNSTNSTLLTKLVMFWNEVIGQRTIQNKVAKILNFQMLYKCLNVENGRH